MDIMVKNGKVSLGDSGTFFNCVFGKNGFTYNKIEGDEKTPIGNFSIEKIFFRKDRVGSFKTDFELIPIEKNYGWCDDVNSNLYNHFVLLPFAESHEDLWREDELYDIIVVLSYNTNPVIKGKGSAIFIHVAKPNMKHTKGCIALEKRDLITILGLITRSTKVEILE
ncbi:MAG: L,D-transpeptidase family protein [bacterium]